MRPFATRATQLSASNLVRDLNRRLIDSLILRRKLRKELLTREEMRL